MQVTRLLGENDVPGRSAFNYLIERGLVDGFLQKLVADAWFLRNGEKSVFRLEIILRQTKAGIHPVAGVMLVDDEVGNHRL